MTLNAYRQRLDTLRDRQTHYNRLLSRVGQAYSALLNAEPELMLLTPDAMTPALGQSPVPLA
ncbi:MAG: hypothetical protein LVS60_02210 [Nodosilinea sp. LVE1205-7]|jgi:hypothetical protein